MSERDAGDSPIDRDAVAARAYALYVRRGMKPGREIDDWIEAERQLRSEAVGAALAKVSGAPTPVARPAAPPARPPAPTPAPASPAEAPAAGVSKKGSKKQRKR